MLCFGVGEFKGEKLGNFCGSRSVDLDDDVMDHDEAGGGA